MVAPVLPRRENLIARGGGRNGADKAKATVLGPERYGLAAPLLAAVRTSTQATIAATTRLEQELCTAMFLLAARTERLNYTTLRF